MYFSIILGALTISTEEIESSIVLAQIAAYELVSTEDGGIASFSLIGNNEELVYHCKGSKAWSNVLDWFKRYQKEIIEGMTQEIKKESKKARF